MFLFGKVFKLAFLFIFLAELLSLFGYLLPDFGQVAFFVIVLLALALSLRKLEYGFWLLLTELFIGSKGYLFFFEHDGLIISVRMALWLIIMSVFIYKCPRIIKQMSANKHAGSRSFGLFFRTSFLPYFFILFIFIVWGLANGFLSGHSFYNIFFDFNGWLYFALIFPLYNVIAKNDRLPITIMQIFIAAIIWMSLKTFFLLFVFSHDMASLMPELYRWVRVTGVGEITRMQGGFYRVFFQSHIFALAGFFVMMALIVRNGVNNKAAGLGSRGKLILLSVVCCLLSVVLVSFSRSYWVGLAAGLLLYGYIVIRLYSWRRLLKMGGILAMSLAVSVGFIAAIVKFPYPSPTGGFSTTKLFSERAGQISGEAGVSSRWALLPELWSEIKEAPILGRGFGSTVTYKTSDPRALNSSATGEYTTYAFEWGWLDIWLKLGLVGMVFYLALISKICISGFKYRSWKTNFKSAAQIKLDDQNLPIQKIEVQKYEVITGLTIGLVVITVVSFFSPYLNHPLGIGYLVLVSAIIQKADDSNFRNPN